MDLQTRKLNAIGYLISLKDEKIFNKIESVIFEKNTVTRNKKFKPFSQKQLIERAQQSNNDYLAGKFKTQEQLEKESHNW